ncbi:MAG: M15 family metallopeptidase [Bacteroidetes bacterium]|nr:M15 family metallopeptidase [Bacteroidota bacterium]
MTIKNTNNALTYLLTSIGIVFGITLIVNRKKIMDYAKMKVWDVMTETRIANLHPKIRGIARTFVNRAEKELGIKVRITDGYRSIEEQNKLYAQGRTTPGSIVTNAQGGSSYHNYALAFDVVPIENGIAVWNNNNHWNKLGQLGKSLGLEWGGDFKSILDKPHFQKTYGLTTGQLLSMYNTGKTNQGYVTV